MQEMRGITFLKVKNGRLIPFAGEENSVWHFRETDHFPFPPTQQPVLIWKFQYFYLYDNFRNSSPFISNNVTEKCH